MSASAVNARRPPAEATHAVLGRQLWLIMDACGYISQPRAALFASRSVYEL